MPMKRILYSFFLAFSLMFAVSTAQAQSDAGDKSIPSRETTVSMYPIPTTGILYINFNKTITSEPVLLVYDMIGNPIEQVVIERENPTTFSVNLSGKKPGFYFLKVTADHTTFSRRITINP